MKNFLFVFIDGLGISLKGDDNPFLKRPLLLTKIFREITNRGFFENKDYQAFPISPLGEIGGIPQSATNQSTIFTGVDCVKYHGGHKSGFPDRKLKEVLKEESIFKKIKEMGLNPFFANAFTPEYFNGKRKNLSVTTLCGIYGGIKFRSIFDIPEKRAIFHDFTNISLNLYGYDIPIFDTLTASSILLDISKKFDFTLYEFFLTDIAGHMMDMDFAVIVLEILNSFLENLLTLAAREKIPLLITSDHGNIEDLSVKHHTKNDVLFLYSKFLEKYFKGISLLREITPDILEFLRGGKNGR